MSPEKSKFAQTCDLLSQYLKENRNSESKGEKQIPATIDFLSDRRKPLAAAEVGGGSGSGQMTIFYGGKVMVFNEFPANKAAEIINLASSGGFSGDEQNIASFAGSGNNSSYESHPHRSQAILYDFPLTRTASLQRFFAKRKDRIAARAPYQTKNTAGAFTGVSAGESTKPWMDFEDQCDNKVELKLW